MEDGAGCRKQGHTPAKRLPLIHVCRYVGASNVLSIGQDATEIGLESLPCIECGRLAPFPILIHA